MRAQPKWEETEVMPGAAGDLREARGESRYPESFESVRETMIR